MTASRFVQGYAGYLVSRLMPPRFASADWSLPRRFRYRVYWLHPEDIRNKPANLRADRPPRQYEQALLAEMAQRFVVGGDWDIGTRPFQLHPTVEEIFVRGLPMRSTSAFRWMIEAIHAGDTVASRGLKTLEEVEARFERLERIYLSMASDGYRTQLRLGRPPVDEITVCIGRGGSPLLLRHGNHRLSMAKVLRVTQVPVIVRGVHREWVRGCSERFGVNQAVTAVERGLASLSEMSLVGRSPPYGGA